MTTWAEAETKLSEVISGYQKREPQARLAQAIENSFSTRSHLLGEAGCGTGKSVAAMIPAILSGKRVVYSTATKALQDQITGKDLPDLEIFFRDHLGINFKWALLKGRSNYLCATRAEGVDPSEVPSLGAILKVVNESDFSFSGEKTDLEAAIGQEIPFAEWAKIRADSEICSENQCSKANDNRCFAVRARKAAAGANVVVVNHALFSMDLIYSNAMIGQYDAVIFDEAHELRTYVRDALGSEFSERSFIALNTEIRNICKRDHTENEAAITKAGAKVIAAQKALFESFERMPDIKKGGKTARLRADDFSLQSGQWESYILAVQEYTGQVERIASHLNSQSVRSLTATQKRLQSLKKRARNLSNKVTNLREADHSDLVRWVEKEGTPKDRFGVRWIIKCCPIDVAPFLSENLFSVATCILISATLQVGEKFDFIAKQLGVEDYNSLNVGTPFDYKTQARLFVPATIPHPTQKKEAFDTASVIYMENLVKASDGRALLLFTSIAAMKRAYETLQHLPYKVLMQNMEGKSNKQLAEEFKADKHSVLLGTKSFMTGFDAQGETCSLVIIDRIPFNVPTEPLFEAESEIIKKRGGSDFNELSVPSMILTITQAAGRLIRTTSDQGVLAILDPRVISMNYGKRIVNSLPPFTMVNSIGEVKEFFASIK